MIDLIKSAKTIQKALDKQTLENTTSGWMEENVMQAIYNGGFEIKINHCWATTTSIRRHLTDVTKKGELA